MRLMIGVEEEGRRMRPDTAPEAILTKYVELWDVVPLAEGGRSGDVGGDTRDRGEDGEEGGGATLDVHLASLSE